MRPRVLLDANLLLLLLIGTYDSRLLTTFKRVNAFTVSDFELLRDFASAHRLVTTPHVLTEVSNLGTSLPQGVRSSWLRHFGLFAVRFDELHTPLLELIRSPIFSAFGLTDAAISSLASSVLLITEDGRLRDYLARRGHRSFSLKDIRVQQATSFERL